MATFSYRIRIELERFVIAENDRQALRLACTLDRCTMGEAEIVSRKEIEGPGLLPGTETNEENKKQKQYGN